MATRFSLQERNVKAGTTINVSGSGSLVKLDDPGNIKKALDSVRTGTLAWALLGYTNNQYDTITLLKTGNGGVDELTANLTKDIAAYGLVRIEELIDGNISTQRFCYIIWIGDDVPGMKKAKIGTNKSSVNEIIGHFNIEITASTLAEISPEVVQDKVKSTTGSKSTAKNTWEVQQGESKKIEKKSSGPCTYSIKFTMC